MYGFLLRVASIGLALVFAALTVAVGQSLILRRPIGVIPGVAAQVPNVACTPGQAITWDGAQWSCVAVTGAAGATQWTGMSGAAIHYLFPVSIGTAAPVPGASLTLGAVAHGVAPTGSDANSALSTKGYVLGQISGLASQAYVNTEVAAAISGVTGGAQAWSATSGNVFRASGNVGIGTGSPAARLHVSGSGGQIRLQSMSGTVDTPALDGWIQWVDQAGTPNFYIGDGDNGRDALALVAQRPNTAILFATNNTERVVLTSGGQLGIGTNTPQTVLDVAGPVRIGTSSATCSGTIEGATRFNATSKLLEVCNGTAWTSLAAGAGALPTGCSAGAIAHFNGSNWICGNQGTVLQELSTSQATSVGAAAWSSTDTGTNATGTQILSLTLTPTYPNSVIEVVAVASMQENANSSDTWSMGIFRNGTSRALAFTTSEGLGNNAWGAGTQQWTNAAQQTLTWSGRAGGTGAITISVRVGAFNGNTVSTTACARAPCTLMVRERL